MAERKTIESYLDEVKAKTGKSVDHFLALAAKKGLRKGREVVTWLNTEFGLGYHQAGAVWYLLSHADDHAADTDQKIAAHFTGGKARWRKPYDALVKKVAKFGKDVWLSPNMTYINILRGNKKIAIIQPSAGRLDIGLKLKGVKPTARFEAAGRWNTMVTHRVRITDPKQIDKDVLAWLRQAYEAT